MTGQTKKHSATEAIINILIGYGIALLSQIIMFPLYGINITLGANIQIGIWFTLISFARSYFIRRWFNKIMLKVWEKTDGR